MLEPKIDKTFTDILEDYIKKVLDSDILEGCIEHMTPEEKQQYKNNVLKYFEEEIKPKSYNELFGSCNPKLIAGHIIYKSLIPKNMEHFTIYAHNGCIIYSLITWKELGEILDRPNMAKSYHHYNKINIEKIPLDIEKYNRAYYFSRGYRRIVEQRKCPHCHEYI